MDKVVASPREAVAGVPDGATVAIAGFGLGHRFAGSLITALRDHGAKDLTVVCNSLGGSGGIQGQILAENGQIRKLVAAFSVRPGVDTASERQILAGRLEVELVPQGTLVERCRAGGSGIPAFYTRTGADSDIARGKETREFDGRTYVLEHAIRVDYALLRGHRADRHGNVQFRGGSQNFNPSFARAARIALVEVDEIVEAGAIAPQDVGLPGIFVAGVVQGTRPAQAQDFNRANRRAPDTARLYNGKPGLTRAAIARRAAALVRDGSYVNLGTGIPTLLSNHLEQRDVVLHAENGILGYGGIISGEGVDPDIYNAAGQFVRLRPGASFFDSVASFEMARGGWIDYVVLGAYEVDQDGNLANWSTADAVRGGIGGAMDLVAGAAELVVVMEHTDSKGRPKLKRSCSYPLTAKACVDWIVTDLALLRRTGGRFRLEEVAPGFAVEEVLSFTEMDVGVAGEPAVMR